MRDDDFGVQISRAQAQWRKAHLSCQEFGTYNGKRYAWILPKDDWTEGLWPGIRESLPTYLDRFDIEKHQYAHHLTSSWVLCANLFFPFCDEDGHKLLAGFLRKHVSQEIDKVTGVELEYAAESPLDPKTLLVESVRGKRGANQTSPDVAFLVTTANGRGLILTESKLAEHNFYQCSGYKAADGSHRQFCRDWVTLKDDLPGRCWQMNWASDGKHENRRYWEHIKLSDRAQSVLKRCPAATDGYQLFRQQALAEAIAESDKYQLVVSSVAYDARNSELLHCLNGTADVDNFTVGWDPLFAGRAKFRSWTHQQWAEWVRAHEGEGRWRNWLSYMAERYGY
jgi:hypothetical protein